MSQKPQQKALWYVLQVYAGFEKKVAQSIRETAERKGLLDYFEEILVPLSQLSFITIKPLRLSKMKWRTRTPNP